MELQDFAIPAGDTDSVTFSVVEGTGLDITQPETVITWRAWPQSVGVVADDAEVLISKTVGHGIEITPSPSPGSFTVTLEHADTVDLLGNYYHEAKVTGPLGDITTVTQGIMTVTEAQ